MNSIESSLAEARREVDAFIQATDTCADCWTTPRAPGKWSPSQLAEHIALSFESSANDVLGAQSGFPAIPRFAQPLLRAMLFRKVLRTGTFQKARTNKAMNPARGAESAAAAITRLESTWTAFSAACAEAAKTGDVARSRLFGSVPLADYIRFQGFHTRHHCRQMHAPEGLKTLELRAER